jgi:Arc/MetJ family transcription regulator
VSLIHIEIDDEELETAQRLGGHETKAAAVAEALRQYNQRLNRGAAMNYYFELARDWDIEGAEAAHIAQKRAFDR